MAVINDFNPLNSEAYRATAEDLWEENLPKEHKAAMEGGFEAAPGLNGAGALAKLIAWLRANGITFSMIVTKILPIILAIINGQGNWMSILAAVWAIFFPNTPLPPLSQLPAA